MTKFEVGQVYTAKYSSNKRYGEVAGEIEIVAIRRIDDPKYKTDCVIDCFEAITGEIDFIVRSGSTNEKVKTTNLIVVNYSQEYASKYTKGVREYEWFSPLKRNYQIISSID